MGELNSSLLYKNFSAQAARVDEIFFRALNASMAFGSKLKKWRQEKGFETARDFFEWLGGTEELGFSLRRYQQVEADQFSPPKRLLLVLLTRSPRPDWREFVIDYLAATFRDESLKGILLEFVDQNLIADFEAPPDGLWRTEEHRKLYTQSQMTYLIANKDALRFMKRILLDEVVALDDIQLQEDKIQKLVDLNLIRVAAGYAYPSEILYRIPIYGKAPSSEVAVGTAFIKAHFDAFTSMEGSKKQELVYSTHYVSATSAALVRTRLLSFYKWLRSLSQKKREENSRAITFIGFTKELEDHEL